MSNRNMEMALLIRADLAQARASVQGFGGDLQQVGDTAAATGAALDKIDTSGLDKAGAMAGATVSALESVGQAATGAAAGLQAEGESAAQAEQRIRQMVQASLEYQRAMQAQIATDQALAEVGRGTTEANAERVAQIQQVNQAALESQKAISAEMQAIGELSDRVERGASSLQDLADTEQMMDRAVRAGMLSVEEQAKMFQELDKQERQLLATREREEKQIQGLLRVYDPASAALAKLADDEARLKAAVDAGRISREQYNRAMVGITTQRAQWEQASDGVRRVTNRMDSLNLSARNVRNSLASVATQLAQGNVAGAGSSLLSLGTRGAASFGALGLAIGGTVAVLGLFAASVWQSQKHNDALGASLISSGNSAGKTVGEYGRISDELGHLTGEYAKSQKAVDSLASSGKISGAVLAEAAQAAVDMSTLTGDSIEQTTAKIIKMAKAPSATLLELNDQYRFLTAEVYEHVVSLEQQGKETEAVRVAIEFTAEVYERRMIEMQAQTGALTGHVSELRKEWSLFVTDLKKMAAPTLEIDIEETERRLEQLRKGTGYGWSLRQFIPGDADAGARVLEERLKRLKQEKELQDDLAAGAAYVGDLDKAGVEAVVSINRQLEAGKSKTEQLTQATKDLKEQYRALQVANPNSDLLKGVTFGDGGSISGGSYEKALKSLQEQYKERKPKKTDSQRADEAAQRELENLQKQIALLGDLEDGETKVSEAARIRVEIEQGAFRNSSEALKQQLLAAAPLLDDGRKRIEVAKQLVNVEMEIARLQGRGSDAAIIKTRSELEKLKQDLEGFGDDAQAADVAKLLNLMQARQDLDGFQAEYSQAMGAIALAQQGIQVELQAGLLTEAQAQQRIVSLYKDKLGTLRELVPQMRAAATALGDPAALANVEQIELKLQEMATTTDLLQQSIKNTFETSFANLLTTLVMQTESLSEAVRSFFTSISQGMAEFAAQQISQQLTNWAMSKFDDLAGSAAGTATETAAATAAAATTTAAATTAAATTTTAAATAAAATTGAATAAATALSASGGTILSGASAVMAAAAALQAAATTMMVANSMGGFADGGFTGPGHKYQFAGYVHAGEFVHRQEVVRQPGALAFLRAFNMRGMAVLDGLRGYASGGLVAPAPLVGASAPGYVPVATPQSAAPTVSNRFRFIHVFDAAEVAELIAATPAFEKAVVITAGSNGGAIRGSWEE